MFNLFKKYPKQDLGTVYAKGKNDGIDMMLKESFDIGIQKQEAFDLGFELGFNALMSMMVEDNSRQGIFLISRLDIEKDAKLSRLIGKFKK